jgi:hypothetical protein
MSTVQLVLAPDTVRADLTAETSARIAADAAIIAAGTGAVVDLSACPVTATGDSVAVTLGDRFSQVPAGSGNVPLGRNALVGITTGQGNVAVGINAGLRLSGAGGCVALGLSALSTQTTGSGDVAVGMYALTTNPSSTTSNVAVGEQAGYLLKGDANVAVGSKAMNSSFGANVATGNVGVGHMALAADTSGDYNVAVGYKAGLDISSGSGNTILGANSTGAAITDLSDVIILYSGGVERARYQSGVWVLSGVVRGDALQVGSGGPEIMAGAVDPSAGAGVAAVQGSIYLRTNGGASTTLYVKTGAADTNWTAK